MIYEYRCNECSQLFDVIKSHILMDHPEDCVHCDSKNTLRQFPPSQMRVELCNTQVQDRFYSPALGKVVRGISHLRAEAKARNWEEVGTESTEKIHKQFDQERKKKLATRYDDIV